MSFWYSIVNYLYESCSGSITSVGEETLNFSAIVYLFMWFQFNKRGFLFPLELGIGCFILLWRSPGIQYNY